MYNQREQPQQFITWKGYLNEKRREQELAALARKGIDRKKVVFVFPGNNNHHRKGGKPEGKRINVPYDIDRGWAGLANVAEALSDQGLATSSLTTTFRGAYENNPDLQKVLAEEAIADLWRLVGYGMHIVLPIRDRGKVVKEWEIKAGKKIPKSYFARDYFFSETSDRDDNEPSLWGGIEGTANKKIADYYLKELRKLNAFLENQARNSIAEVPSEFAQAYEEGLAAKEKLDSGQTPGDWFLPPPPAAARTVSPSAVSRTAPPPATKTAPTSSAVSSTAPPPAARTAPTSSAVSSTAPPPATKTAPISSAVSRTAPPPAARTAPTSSAASRTAPPPAARTAPTSSAASRTAPPPAARTAPTSSAASKTAPPPAKAPVPARVNSAPARSASFPSAPEETRPISASLSPSRGSSANGFVPSEPRPLNLITGETGGKIEEFLSTLQEKLQWDKTADNTISVTNKNSVAPENEIQFTIEKSKVSTGTFTQETFDKMAETLKAAGVKQTRIDAPDDDTRSKMIIAAQKFGITISNALPNAETTAREEINPSNNTPRLR